MEIRPKDFKDSPKYRIMPYRVYPKSKLLPQLKRNGFKTAFHNFAPQVLFTALLSDSIAETLFKASQFDMLAYYLKSSEKHLRQNWQSVKVCLKNRYVIENYQIWEDYLSLLRWFKKDLGSAVYVCPENLGEAHHRLVPKKRAIQKKNYLVQIRSEIVAAQKIYALEKKVFFGLRFCDRELCISVIENVQDFMDEGDALHHYLFTNEFHKKKNSLMLSAKVDNYPVETIEVSLKNMEIIQCRGLKNNTLPHHSRIISLLNRNLHHIKRRIKMFKACS